MVELPAHIDGEEGLMVTVGLAFTLIVIDDVPVQPCAFVPVTVYVVDVDGVTTFEDPVPSPWLHEYALDPEAVIVVLCPWHIVVGEALSDAEPVEIKTLTVSVAV